MDANKKINIFRLIHFDNLEETLRNGMYSRNSGHIVPNFVNIGDTTLINPENAVLASSKLIITLIPNVAISTVANAYTHTVKYVLFFVNLCFIHLSTTSSITSI